MQRILLLLALCYFGSTFGQGFNIDSISTINYQQLHDANLNDVWGYEDGQGNEYALVGTTKGVSIVDISDPANPQEIYWHPGGESTWRDLIVWDDYAYISTEAEDGLLIIDLSPLPGGNITNTNNYFGPTGNEWEAAHNVWVDENGFAYIFGSNRGEGGAIILDLNTDPMNPTEVGTYDDSYIHDGYVRGDTLYAAHIFEGYFSIVDVTDKSNPIVLGTQNTPSNFAHNIWPTDDSKHVFTTDEVSGGYLAAYNVENPGNAFETDRIQSSPGSGIVPHNVHVYGDFLVTSYYSDGVKIHDISDPENMIEVGSYDTYPGTSTSTIGCWGAYPYFSSGILLASDMIHGLFILSPNYEYAAKLEGTVTNADNGDGINDVSITIDGHDQVENSNISGEYKTGIGEGGNYTVTYEKYGFEPKSFQLNLAQGDTLIHNVELVPLDEIFVTVNVSDESGNPILDANVRMDDDVVELNGMTDGTGSYTFTVFYETDYEIIAGKWGFITHCNVIYIDGDEQYNVVLKEGIYDDFSFDYGWSTSSSATKGQWKRGVPIGTGDPGEWLNPDYDSENDCGKYAFVTGNKGIEDDWVSNGYTFITSPNFDLSGYDDPYIHFEKWFYNNHGVNPPNDTLKVRISNGTQFADLDIQGRDPDIFHKWVPVTVRIKDKISLTNNMTLYVYTEDEWTHSNVVVAGFDNFYIVEEEVLNISENTSDKIKVYPNPSNDIFNIEGLEVGEIYYVINNIGEVVKEAKSESDVNLLNLEDFSKGVYFLRHNRGVEKLIKK